MYFIRCIVTVTVIISTFVSELEGFMNNSSFENAISSDVVIIGGGISGLSALNILSLLGIDAILLEAENRLGGRINSFKSGNGLLEDGAEWIVGETNNALYTIANRENQLAPLINSDEWGSKILRNDGTEAPEDKVIKAEIDNIIKSANTRGKLKPYFGRGYGDYFIDKLKNGKIFNQTNPTLPAWSHYLQQRVNCQQGTSNWTDIGAFEVNKFISFGPARKWKDGYNFILNYLTRNISSEKIHLSSPVKKIIWNGNGLDGVIVQTDSSEYLAKHAIITTSIGYLKKNHESLFIPPLPSQFSSNFKEMQLGGPNKIYISWITPWWKEKYLYLTVLWNKNDLPREMNWLYGIHSIFSEPQYPTTLLAFVAGKYSEEMEKLKEEEVKNHFLFALRKLHPNNDIPNPIFVRRTTWLNNQWICGSYKSFITNDGYRAGLRYRAPFRTELVNTKNKKVLFWAGEHTHDTRYGTADGAYSSGLRVSKEIIETLEANRKSENISPLSIIYSVINYALNIF